MPVYELYRDVSRAPLSEIGFAEWFSSETQLFLGHKDEKGFVLLPQFEMREERGFVFRFGRLWIGRAADNTETGRYLVSNILDAFLENDSPYVFHGPIDFGLGVKKHLSQMVDQLCSVLPSLVDEMTIERLQAVENDGSRHCASYQAALWERPGEFSYEPTEVMI